MLDTHFGHAACARARARARERERERVCVCMFGIEDGSNDSGPRNGIMEHSDARRLETKTPLCEQNVRASWPFER